MIADHVATQPTAHWLARMQPVDIWCAEVLDWPTLSRRGLSQARHAADRRKPGWTCGAHDALADPHRRRAQALPLARAAHRRTYGRIAGRDGLVIDKGSAGGEVSGHGRHGIHRRLVVRNLLARGIPVVIGEYARDDGGSREPQRRGIRADRRRRREVGRGPSLRAIPT